MAIKLKKFKKYAAGGEGVNGIGTTPLTAENNPSSKSASSVASNIPVWGQLAGLTTQISGSIRGNEQNTTKNAIANSFDPASTVLEFSNKGDYGDAFVSLINPIGGGRLQANAAKKEAAARAKNIYDAKTSFYTEQGTQRLAGSDLTGNQEEQNIYASGGMIGFSGKAIGGKLNKLNSDTVEVDGKTHAEGGVKLPSAGAEVEDKETISNGYVFSDLLGFAAPHKKLAKQIGKIEKMPASREAGNTLNLLRVKEESLRREQEETKEALGLQEQDKMAMGGRLKKYAFGSYVDNPDMFSLSDRVPQKPAVAAEATTINDNTNSNGSGNGWMSAINGITPYVSNIVNSFRKLPNPAQPILESGISPKLVSYGSDKVLLDKSLRGINTGVDQSTANTNLARATKVANLGKFLDAKGQLTQQENNVNASIINRSREYNGVVNMRNAERRNDYNNSLIARDIQQQNLRSENVADTTNKFQLQQRDNSLKDLESRRLDILPGLYKDSGVLSRNYQNQLDEEHRTLNRATGGPLITDPNYRDPAQDNPERKVSYIEGAANLYIDDNGDLKKRTPKKTVPFSSYQAKLEELKNLPKKRSGGMIMGNRIIPVQSVLKYLV